MPDRFFKLDECFFELLRLYQFDSGLVMGSGLIGKKLSGWIFACGFVQRRGLIKFPACLDELPQISIKAGDVEMGVGVRSLNAYGFLKMFLVLGKVSETFVGDAEVLMHVIEMGIDLQ